MSIPTDRSEMKKEIGNSARLNKYKNYVTKTGMANCARAPSPFNLLFDHSVLKLEVEEHTLFFEE